MGDAADRPSQRLRERRGTLEPDDEALFRRSDRLVKRLKGTDRRSRRQAEGHDDATGSSSPGRHANGNAGQEGRRGELGYPVCTVCGQSVSPLSADRQRKDFRETHTERCGRAPEGIGFHAEVTADVLSLPACDSAATAYSVLEALRS